MRGGKALTPAMTQKDDRISKDDRPSVDDRPSIADRIMWRPSPERVAASVLAEFANRYGPAHTTMIAAQSELADATRNLNIQRRSVAGAI